ncbi:MAG: hypothetical protein JSU77_06185 [Fidelibacterota bacterium]|nr:MAG: hypothetical protein JSU77_06185 [Candidatus Neomarinimicrobiota bacterium]
MGRIGAYACAIGLLLTILPGLQAQSGTRQIPPPRYLTDEEAIRILLHNIREGIRRQDLLLIIDGFASEVEIGDSTTVTLAQVRDSLRTAFAGAEARREDPRFQALTPPGVELTSTWDFGLQIDSVRFLDDRTAVAETQVYFGAAEQDTTAGWQFGRKRRETIHFEKVSGEWRVKSIDELLRIYSLYRSSGEK